MVVHLVYEVLLVDLGLDGLWKRPDGVVGWQHRAGFDPLVSGPSLDAGTEWPSTRGAALLEPHGNRRHEVTESDCNGRHDPAQERPRRRGIRHGTLDDLAELAHRLSNPYPILLDLLLPGRMAEFSCDRHADNGQPAAVRDMEDIHPEVGRTIHPPRQPRPTR